MSCEFFVVLGKLGLVTSGRVGSCRVACRVVPCYIMFVTVPVILVWAACNSGVGFYHVRYCARVRVIVSVCR